MSVLVAGGAGYIGSHTVRALCARGEDVVVLDSLATGHRAALPTAARLYVGDLRDRAFLRTVFAQENIDCALHFAAFSLVGESVNDPLKYYDNNLGGAIALLDAMRESAVDKIVFSSTAAVYGEPETVPIDEKDRTVPTNPYGETKLAMEKLFGWAAGAYGLRYVPLRYFNACGADASGDIGEDHSPESHLIPLILQVPKGQRPHISIFGTDYPTADGTCVRDYIHVTDLAQAHLLAMDYLRAGGPSDVFNLGTGTGFSVREVIETARRVTGHPIPALEAVRRPGDPARLVASGEKARRVLGWQPAHAGLEEIVRSAWRWHEAHPHGFADKTLAPTCK